MLKILLKRPLSYAFQDLDSFYVGRVPSQWNGDEAIRCGYDHLVKYCAETVTREGADQLAANGALKALEFLLTKDIFCTGNGLVLAVRNGHLPVVRLLLDWHCFPVWDNVIDEACKSGRIEMISFFQEKSYIFNTRTANIAAEHGQLEVVRYFRSQGIHCTNIGASLAARYRHTKVVEDLRNHGIEEDSFSRSEVKRLRGMLKYSKRQKS